METSYDGRILVCSLVILMTSKIQMKGAVSKEQLCQRKRKVCVALAYMLLEEEDINRKSPHMLDVNL